jgi:sugar diacid utilization regulator
VDDRRRHHAAAGLDPAGALICAVGRIERSPVPADVALQHVKDALDASLAAGRARPLMPIRHGEIVLLASGASSRARLPSLRTARTVVADEHGIDVRFGVSMPAAGFAGVRSAYREAVLALSHASSGRPIVPLDDLSALESVLVGVSATARAVLAAQARDLMALPAADRAMIVATVRALAASDLNVKRTAQHLQVHPNTVRYRQQRIAATTGHDPRTFGGLADLFCVVELLDSESDHEPRTPT